MFGAAIAEAAVPPHPRREDKAEAAIADFAKGIEGGLLLSSRGTLILPRILLVPVTFRVLRMHVMREHSYSPKHTVSVRRIWVR